MKNIVKIMSFISFLIITSFIVIILELNQREKYVLFNDYKFQNITFKDDDTITNQQIIDFIDLARENNVIITKTYLSDDITNIYVNVENIESLYSLINSNFELSKFEDKKFLSTFDKDGIIIKDFLNNSKYNYKLFSELIDEGKYLYGNYKLFYQNDEQLENFFSVSNINSQQFLSQVQTSTLNYTTLSYIVIILILLLGLFYYVFQIYSVYNQSKKIGCMKLLGIDNKKIYKNIILEHILVELIFVVLITSVCLFLPNITFKMWSIILLANLSMLLFILYIDYICIKKISANCSISSILKKEDITKPIAKTSIFLKMAFSILILIFVGLFQSYIIEAVESYRTQKNIEPLLNYAVFYGINENLDKKNFYKLNNIYSELGANDIDYFYADFSKYNIKLEEDLERTIIAEKNHEYYRFASVDKNYLDKINLVLYDNNNNTIDEISSMSLAFPKSKINEIEPFIKYYNSYCKVDYDKYNYPLNFNIYVYEDTKMPTFRLEENILSVESPILRIITNDFPIPYLETPCGINVAATGMNTSLKIKINNDREETYNRLYKILLKYDLNENLTPETFVSYSEYLSDTLSVARDSIILCSLTIIVIMTAYIFILIQFASILIKSNENIILVKKILGFEFYRIYKKLIIKNFLFTIISIVLSLLILRLLGQIEFSIIIIASIIFTIIDSVVFLLIINKKKLNLNSLNEYLLKR